MISKFKGLNPSLCRRLVLSPTLNHLAVGIGFRADAGHELAAAARPLRLELPMRPALGAAPAVQELVEHG